MTRRAWSRLSGESEVPEFIRPSQRPNQFGLMLRQLESLRATGGACLSRLLQQTVRLVHRRSVILFFSDLLEPSEEVALGFKQLRFHGHEVIIFQVLDRDETEFPFTESRLFEDLETGVRRMVTPAGGAGELPGAVQCLHGGAPGVVPQPGDDALRGAHGREPVAGAGAVPGGEEAA